MRTRIGGTLLCGVLLAVGAPAAGAVETTLLRYRVQPGAHVDLGSSGIAHAQPWPAAQILAFARTCGAERTSCTLGGGRAGDPFGAPIPLSAGGTPSCVVSRLREAVAGTMQPADGCAEIRLALTARVHVAQDVARPCPVCEGDPTANDGRRDGRCSDGSRSGKPCDAHAASALFGATSHDCLPSGAGAGDLTLDLVLTTGKSGLEGGTPCVNPRPGGTCPCQGQRHKNECRTGVCPEAGRCDQGPFDGICDGQPYRSCLAAHPTSDCEERFPGAGRCTLHARRCFGETIAAAGTCHPTTPTFVAIFCAPATRAPALNASAGLPGPARLTLPLALLPAPAAAPEPRPTPPATPAP